MSNTKTVMGQASNQYVAPTDITDVFSTYLYEGTSASKTITNGLDLGGEGGLVWIKKRNESTNSDHMLYDTERGPNERLFSNDNGRSYTRTDQLNSFDSDGFTLGADSPASPNTLGKEYVSWSFRKAPKFFTCLTYTGTGPGSAANEQQVSHDLGAKPGIVIIKRTDATGDWWVFTDVIDGSNDYGYLNQTAAFGNSGNNVATDSVFSVGGILNTSGATYVAYLFANNDGDGGFGPDGSDIIKCGSYTGNGADDGPEINLGFEPQWLLVKRASGGTGEWALIDTMRGFTADGSDAVLKADSFDAENSQLWVSPSSTGFKLRATSSAVNASGNTYIYIAIRRGPLAEPESATDVFAIDTRNSTGEGVEPGFRSGFGAVDFALQKYVTVTDDWRAVSRLTQGKQLQTQSTAAETTLSYAMFDYSNGWSAADGTNSNLYSWMWKRAPGYFDTVAYTGNGTAGRTVGHNLTVPPEMMWVKVRNAISKDWIVYHKDLDATAPEDKYLKLNENIATLDGRSFWQDTAPTSTEFTVGTNTAVNASGSNYIAYLFASLPGISKVGSVSHTSGSATDVDCGFTSGARFILLKVTDSSGSWFVYDTTRGIVAGNDARLKLDSTAAENTGNDDIDPLSSGFTITSTVSTGNYIFYAIA
jgi:hypothetical protein